MRKTMSKSLEKIDAVILCGGLGTRLRPVLGNEIPKVLAPLGEKILLDITLERLREAGFKRIILAVGHLKEQIKLHLTSEKGVVFSEEDEPLGTGGALKKALPRVKSGTFLVINGDMLFNLRFSEFLDLHVKNQNLMSMAVAKKNRDDVGNIGVGADFRIAYFKEKTGGAGASQDFMNVGAYFFEKEAAELFPAGDKFSLEYDFFPEIIKTGKCMAYKASTQVLDIGTPERYASWQKFLN